MEQPLYFRSILRKKIVLDAKYLNSKVDEYILSFLKNRLEGKCIHDGYVKPDSVRILRRSVGMLVGSRFTGDITYEIAYSAEVCNPVEGNIYECKVKKINNKSGIMASLGPLMISVGKQFHEDNLEIFDTLKVGDTIKVIVLGKTFALNDKEIKVVGKLYIPESRNKKSKKNVTNMVQNVSKRNTTTNETQNVERDDEMSLDDIEITSDEDSGSETQSVDDEDEVQSSEDEDEDEDEAQSSEDDDETQSHEGGVQIGGVSGAQGLEDDFAGNFNENVEDDINDMDIDDDMDGDDGDDDDGYYSDD
jgi:DNA-directed RNA polymerase subunit E'/Rpb7